MWRSMISYTTIDCVKNAIFFYYYSTDSLRQHFSYAFRIVSYFFVCPLDSSHEPDLNLRNSMIIAFIEWILFYTQRTPRLFVVRSSSSLLFFLILLLFLILWTDRIVMWRALRFHSFFILFFFNFIRFYSYSIANNDERKRQQKKSVYLRLVFHIVLCAMRWHGIQKVEIPIVSNMMKLWNNSRIFLIVLIARVKVTKSGFVYRLTKELSEMGRKMSSLINVDISYFILCSTQQSRAKKKTRRIFIL